MWCFHKAYQFLFLVFFFLNFKVNLSSSSSSFSSSTTRLCSHDEAAALIQFKSSFLINEIYTWFSDCDYDGIESYPKTDSWKEGTDCCSWDGVTCDDIKGHVIGLDLRCNRLYGTIPSNSTLFYLSHLQKLNLAFNDFKYSKMPSKFGEFTNLVYLDLSHTYFAGQVPSQVSRLSKLVSLDLSGNLDLTLDTHTLEGLVHNLTEVRQLFLDGINMSSINPNVLINLSSSLRTLSLRSCDLQGKFPEKFFYLPNLKMLNLGGNVNLRLSLLKLNQSSHLKLLDLSYMSFSSEVFDSVGNLEYLEQLDVSNTIFYGGGLANSIGNLISLKYLDLSSSNLSGSIPRSLGNLISLKYLNLSSSSLLGSILRSLGNLTSLEHLDLSHCNLSGSIPRSLGNLISLKYLDLSSSSLSGSILRSLGNLTSLEHLDLSSSNLSGSIPRSVGNLISLKDLDLSSSSLSGSILRSLGNLTSLEHLDLSDSNLSGSILRSLGNLTSLEHLDLSHSNLSGSIPRSLGNLISLKYLDLSSSSLSGSILRSLGNLTSLEHVDLSHSTLLGSIPRSLGTLFSLKYLDLSSSSLSGSILRSLGNLTSLEHLDLSRSSLSGSIPRSLGNLISLKYLDLSSSNLSGSIPSSLGNLSRLSYLDLSNNLLEGSLPDEVSAFPNLISLYLDSNLLNGTLPSWLYTISSLKSIRLSNNQFSGHIKEFQYNSLEVIDIRNTKLQGPIPSSISQFLNLTVLFLSSNNLSGTVEFGMFSKLQNLQYLVLGDNSLSLNSNGTSADYTLPHLLYLDLSSCNVSEFPQFLRGSTRLQQLILSNNRIYGKIPEWMLDVGNDSLRNLNLSHNSLTDVGQLPWKKIGVLDLSSNLIHGDLPIPPLETSIFFISNNSLNGEISSLLCNLSSLELLDLSHNNLSGIIPQCFGNLSESLLMLNLGVNKFHGLIPPTFTKGCQLMDLILKDNQLEGPLTQSILNCASLEVLDLGHNKINDTFPHWLGSLPQLQVLVLRSNQLHGSIHGNRSGPSFSKIQIFDLSSNYFSGTLPVRYIKNFEALINLTKNESAKLYMGTEVSSYRSDDFFYSYSIDIAIKGVEMEVVKIFTMLASIDLSNNKFQGEIAEVIGKLNSLKGLNLSHNNLNGFIPKSIGNLISLEWLDLSSNNLIGTIPEELLDLTSLSILNVSENQLEGQIPQGKQFNTFGNDSYEGNKGLCGFPVSKGCSNSEPPPSSLPEEDSSKSSIAFGWKVVLTGYGCGVVFGLAMGYVVFRTGKPKWFVTLVEDKHCKRRKR